MPDQNLPKPPELPIPAPASFGEAQQFDPPSADDKTNLMQSAPNSSAARISPSASSTPPNQNPGESPQRIPHWLQQAERFLRVIVRMYLGLLVCCAPWYPPAWDNNPLFASSPWLLSFVTQGAVRGLISGLGILNLWIAIREALRNSSDPDLH
jgi:hypothetical protein